MIKLAKAEIEFYQSHLLLQYEDIGHFFSSKKGDFTHLIQLADGFNLDSSQIVIGKQTHSDNIVIINLTNREQSFAGVDAFITQEKGICIAIKTADCTPVLLYDPVQKVVAAVHSGWRGTVQNITGKTISKMVEEFHVQPENIIAAIGPCIGWPNYEVGEEVADQFRTLFPQINGIVQNSFLPGGKAKISIRHAIYHQLIAAGLKAAHIELAGECTYDDANFYSARRDSAQTGRMVNGIWLK